MATKKEVIFKVGVEGDDAIKEIKDIDKNMSELADTIETEVTSSISVMEDKLYDLALQGKQNTKEFIELQEQTAKYKKVIIETDRSIDALAEQGKGLSTALAIGETTVAGFQAFTGVTALMGTENEELLETITKLQAAQGILNSIEVVKQQLQNNSIKLTQLQAKTQTAYNTLVGKGTILEKASTIAKTLGAGAMKALNAVMNANPIMLIVAGLTALVGALAWFFSSTEKAEKMNEELNKTMEREHELLDKSIAKTKKLGQQRLEVAEASGASEKELHKLRLSNLKEDENARKQQIKQEKKDILRKKEIYKQALREENEELAKTIKSEIKESKKKYKELISQNGDYQHKKKIEELNYQKFLDDQRQSELDKQKEARQKRIEAIKAERLEAQKILEEQYQLEEQIRRMRLEAEELEEIAIADKYDSLIEKAHGNAELEKKLIEQQTIELNILYAKREAEKEAIEKEALEKKIAREEQQFQLLDEITSTAEENEIAKLVKSYEQKFALAEGNQELEVQLQTQLNEKIKEVNDKYRDLEKQAEEKAKQEKIERFNQYVDTVSTGLNAISNLNNLVADIQISRAEGDQKKQEKIAERAFKINKAMQLSIATISGIQAVQNAYTTGLASPIQAVNPAYAFIQAGIAGVNSAINIAKIASSKYKSSSMPSTPSGGGQAVSTGATASSFQIGDDTSSTQTNLNPDGTQQNQMQKVFVSEIDISKVQNDVEAIEVKSTF